MFPSYSQYGELDALADDLEYRAALARQQAALQRGVAPQPPRVRRAQPQPRMRPAPVPRYIPRPEVEPYDYGFQMEEAPYEYTYAPTPTRYPVTAAAPVYEPYGVSPVYQSGYGRPRPIPRVAATYEPEDAIPVYDRSRQALSYPQYYEDEDDGEDYSDVPPPLIPISPRAVVPRRQPVPRAPGPREAPVLRQRQPAPRRVSFEPSYEEEEEQQPQRSPSHARQDSASPPNTVQDIASILGQLLGGARQTQSQPHQQPERRPEPSSTQPSITDVLGQVLGSVMQQIQQPQQQPQRPQPQAPRTRAAARQDAMARASQGFRDALVQRTRAAAPPTGPVEESPMTWADYLDSPCGPWEHAPAQRQRAVPQTAPAPAPRQPPAAPAQPEEAQAPSLQDFLANIVHLAAQHSQQQQQNPESQSQAQSELPPSLMRSAQPQPQTRAQPQPQAQPAQQKTSSTPAHAQAPVEPKTSYTYAAPASAQPAAIPHPHPKPHSSSPALPIPGRAYQHIPHNTRDPDAQTQAQGIRKAGVADEVADIKEAIRRSLADRAGVEVHGPQQAPSAASPAAASVNANSHVNSHPHNTSTATAAATSSSSAKKSSIEGAVSTDSRAPTEPVHEGSESESPTPASAAAAHLAQIAKIEERFVNLSYDFNFPAAPEFSPSATASSASSPTSASASAPSLAYTHVNQPIRAYELALTGLLTDLDAVESAGDEEVRHARKELVERIEGALETLERQKDEAWAKVSAASSPVSATAPPVVLEPEAEVAREDSKEDAVSHPASEDVVEQQAAASDEGYVIPSELEPEVAVVEDANATAPVADATDVEPAKVVSDPESVSPAPLLHDSEDVMVTQAQPLPASQLQSVESESSAAAASPDNRAIPALVENPAGTPSDAHEDLDVTVSTPPAASAMTSAPSRSLAEIDQPAVSYAAVAAGATPSTSIGTADSASSSSSSYPPVPPTSPSASANPAKDSFHDEPSAQTPYVNNEEPEEEEPEHVIDSLGSSPVDIPSELDSDFDEEGPRRVAENGVQKEKEPEVIPPSMEEAAEVESKTEFVML